jgi:hypothetical protein
MTDMPTDVAAALAGDDASENAGRKVSGAFAALAAVDVRARQTTSLAATLPQLLPHSFRPILFGAQGVVVLSLPVRRP